MASIKNILSGVVLGTIAGSLAVLFSPKRDEILDYIRDHSSDLNDLTDKAMEYGGALFNKGKQLDFRRVEYRTNYLPGIILGLGAGMIAGLAMAPKSGKAIKAMRGHITDAYNDISKKSEKVIHEFQNNSHNPFASGHTTQNGVKKRKPAVKKAAPK